MNLTKRNKRRKRNYIILRKSGYNSIEANRYKDVSRSKIEALISAKRDFKKLEANIIGGKIIWLEPRDTNVIIE